MAEPAQNEVGAPDPEDEDRDVQQEHLADRHGPQSLKLGQDLRRVAEIDDDADHHEAEQDRQSLTSSCPGSSPGGNARRARSVAIAEAAITRLVACRARSPGGSLPEATHPCYSTVAT